MKNVCKVIIFSYVLFFQLMRPSFLQAEIECLSKENEKNVEERGGLGFVFSLPSNLSTELSFKPKLSRKNAKLSLSMMHHLSAAYETKKLILENKVNLVILIGSCYSKLPEINYGDLVYVSGYLLPKKRALIKNSKAKNSDQIFYLHVENKEFSQRIEEFLEKESENLAKIFNEHGFETSSESKLVSGLVISGDTFTFSEASFNELKKQYPSLMAADIEGSAVSKICKKYNVPLLSIKMIFPELNPQKDSLREWISVHKEMTEAFFKDFIKDISEFFSKKNEE